jgi:hypothetical protein
MVASIINGAAGDHNFTFTAPTDNIHNAQIAGYRISGSSGGSWSYIHGEELIPIAPGGKISFQDPSASWGIAWQEAVATGVYTGISGTPPPGMSSGEGNGGVGYGFCWPRGTDPAVFAPDGDFQASGIQYDYTTIGAYGPPGCIAFAFGWAQ